MLVVTTRSPESVRYHTGFTVAVLNSLLSPKKLSIKLMIQLFLYAQFLVLKVLLVFVLHGPKLLSSPIDLVDGSACPVDEGTIW